MALKRNKVRDISKFSPTQNFYDYTLQKLMKNVLSVAQVFAVLPVSGIRKNSENLKFCWMSFTTIYTISTIIMIAIYSVVLLVNSILTNEGFLSFVVIIWNVRSLIGLIFFLRLAKKWPKLLQQWNNVEMDMLCYGPPTNLKLRFKILSFGFLLTGLVEHFLFVYSAGIREVITKIKPKENFAQLYFETVYDGFFDIFEYAHWKAIYVEFIAVVTTFVWQFTDLFLVLMSSSLAERFKQINSYILENKVLSEAEWRTIRKQYNDLSILCNLFNKSLSEVILISYSANVYFISITLFQILNSKSVFEMIFLLFNIVFIVTHFVLVSIYSSWVYEESEETISELSSLSLKYVNHEVDRLLNQMAEREIGIWGGGLFKVTRKVVFNVFNLILTLQLIFVQFKATFSPKVN